MKRIIVCDSGLGGLNIAAHFFAPSAMKNAAPCELFFFNAYPEHNWGFNKLPTPRDQEELFRDQLETMKNYSPDLCLIACNTLSIIFERLNTWYVPPFPVNGIIDAATESMTHALNEDPESSLLILGTKTTAGSGFYSDRLIKLGFASERIRNLACPGLPTLLETDPASPEIAIRLSGYAQQAASLFPQKPEKLILALCCTHFGFAGQLWFESFSRVFGKNITVVDPNDSLTAEFSASAFHYLSRIPFFPGEQEKMCRYFEQKAPGIAAGLRNASPVPALFPFNPEKYTK